MKLKREEQYALLLVSYLHEIGQTKVEDASARLEIPYDFLSQIVRRMRRAGVVGVMRGPGGGVFVRGEPTVGQVFAACSGKNKTYAGSVAQRSPMAASGGALRVAAAMLDSAMLVVMNVRVKDIGGRR